MLKSWCKKRVDNKQLTREDVFFAAPVDLNLKLRKSCSTVFFDTGKWFLFVHKGHKNVAGKFSTDYQVFGAINPCLKISTHVDSYLSCFSCFRCLKSFKPKLNLAFKFNPKADRNPRIKPTVNPVNPVNPTNPDNLKSRRPSVRPTILKSDEHSSLVLSHRRAWRPRKPQKPQKPQKLQKVQEAPNLNGYRCRSRYLSSTIKLKVISLDYQSLERII